MRDLRVYGSSEIYGGAEITTAGCFVYLRLGRPVELRLNLLLEVCSDDTLRAAEGLGGLLCQRLTLLPQTQMKAD